MIIRDPDDPSKDKYDEEMVLTFSDWYHEQFRNLLGPFMDKTNPTGAEPVPQNALMNDTRDLSIHVETDKTYYLRIVNMGAFASQYIWFEGHNFTVVELDGVWVEPYETDMVLVSVAQRVSILLKTKKDVEANYPIVGSMDTVSEPSLDETALRQGLT